MPDMNPEADHQAMYAILYPVDGFFRAHLDGAQGWVLSYSFGASSTFFYHKGQRKSACTGCGSLSHTVPNPRVDGVPFEVELKSVR